MTNYSKTTNFTAKDSLVSGDANKIVKGSEIDAEFDNIATASATKANIASPAFTGVVSFPDGTAGDPSITNTGDTNTGLFFSAADTLAFSAAGTAQFTMADGAIAPVTDNDVDLGTSSLEFKDGYFDGTLYTDAINLDGTAITSTAAEINILDGVTATAAELNILDGVTSTASELNILDGVTSTASELNILDGVTSTTAELNILDGVTATTAELNIMDGVTATTAELNIMDGVTSTAAELNILDGVTSTAAELNILDGITATTAELNLNDIETSVGTVVASKVVTVDANKDVSSFRNITLTGELDAGSLDISGDADIDGTLETDALSINGTAVTSTAAELNILDGVTSTAAELNILDGVTSTTAELNILDGVTSTAAELNILDGVTSTAAELNILDGVTSTAAELNILDGVTAVTGELNALDLGSTAVGIAIASKAVVLDSNKDFTGVRNFSITGDLSVAGTTTIVDSVQMTANNAVIFEGATADASETTLTSVDATADRTISLPDQSGTLPVLAAVSTTAITATPEELNVLDGITAVVGELNALDLGSTAVGTAIASKAVILDSNKDYTGIRNFTITGELDAATLDISGDIDVDGTTNLDNVDIDGTFAAITGAFVKASSGASATSGTVLTVEDDDNTEFSILGGSSSVLAINFGHSGDNDEGKITFNTTAGSEDLQLVSSKEITLDAAGEIILDADTQGSGNGVLLKDDGTHYGSFFRSSSNFHIKAEASDQDMIFMGNDGGSEITALTLDMSAAGAATFNSDVTAGGKLTVSDGGNATVASIRFNAGLGISSPSTDQLNFITADVSRFVIASDGSLSTPTAGTSNVRFGVNAGNSIQSGGNYNVLVGDDAGTSITTGDYNVAIGFRALDAEDTGHTSVAVGTWALSTQNYDGNAYNVAVGYLAGEAVTTGVRNTLLGALSGDGLTEGSFNVGVGYDSLAIDTKGSKSTALGYGALSTQNFTSPTDALNTAVGFSAGNGLTTGTHNVIMGGLAGDAITIGARNVAIGSSALGTDDVGDRSVAVGDSSLFSQNSDTNNEVTGNIGVGYAAGYYNVTGTNNTIVGHEAGAGASGNSYSNNSLFGYNAGHGLTTGLQNTIIGAAAGDAVTTGTNNVYIGYGAATTDDQSDQNVVVGAQAAVNMNHGNEIGYATIAGFQASYYNVTGVANTCFGYRAGFGVSGNSNSANTFIGTQAGIGVTTGSNNTTVGHNVGTSITSGDDNQFMGKDAGDTVTTGSRNICIGRNVNPSAADGTNQITLGHDINGDSNGTFSFGSSSGIVHNHFGSDATWTRTSDERLKKNITDTDLGLSFINDLRTVKYNWKGSHELDSTDSQLEHLYKADPADNTMETDVTMHGFIAQEVKAALDTAGVDDWAGWEEDSKGVQRISREMFVIPLVKAVQELSAQVTALQAEVNTLKGD